MKLLYIDSETTGLEKEDRLCQVAYKIGEEIRNEFFKPPLPVKTGAMATHHITNRFLEDKKSFQGSEIWNRLKELLEQKETILIAHNAGFDVAMLNKEGLEPQLIIDTLKIAKHLDPNEIIESYSLQYLRYLLDLNIEGMAHDALGDIKVLEKLFERLVSKMKKEDNSTEDVLNEMIEISKKPSLIKKFRFGKHNGQRLDEVVIKDRNYLEWLYGQKSNEQEKDENWIYTLKHYLKLP